MDQLQLAAVRRASDALRVATRPAPFANYPLGDALRAVAAGDPRRAGLAWDIHQELSRGRDLHTTNSLMLPASAVRGLAVANSGGYLVNVENNRAGVVELLRGAAVLDAGATVLSGLVGNVTIPRETAEATAEWLPTEGTATTPSAPTLGSIALTPKALVALTPVSRQLLMQSTPSVETYVAGSLAKSCKAGFDRGAIRGAGTGGEVLGVLTTPGVQSVTATDLTLDKVLEFQTALGVALGEGCAYVTTEAVAKLLSARPALTSGTERALWTGNLYRGELGGFPAFTSPSVPAGALLFGRWPDLLVGEWGDAIEISADPTTGFTSATVTFRAWITADVALLRPASFAAASAVT